MINSEIELDNYRSACGDVFIDVFKDTERKQRLIENGEEFQTELKNLVERFSIINQYADEEVESKYRYLSGYKPNRDQKVELIIADLEVQTRLLDGHFNCGTKFNPDWLVKVHKFVPDWVEKFFAQFDWRLIASTYSEAVQKVLDTIKQNREGVFLNYYEGELGSNQLRQSAKSVSVFQKLADGQKNQDILVVPAQFGIRHRGRSVRRAREVMKVNECGLGAFTTSIMLLTHSDYLRTYGNLQIDCAGDEFGSSSDVFSASPFFRLDLISLKFGARAVSNADPRFGSASLYLP